MATTLSEDLTTATKSLKKINNLLDSIMEKSDKVQMKSLNEQMKIFKEQMKRSQTSIKELKKRHASFTNYTYSALNVRSRIEPAGIPMKTSYIKHLTRFGNVLGGKTVSIRTPTQGKIIKDEN
jgi:hypothetical protein